MMPDDGGVTTWAMLGFDGLGMTHYTNNLLQSMLVITAVVLPSPNLRQKDFRQHCTFLVNNSTPAIIARASIF